MEISKSLVDVVVVFFSQVPSDLVLKTLRLGRPAICCNPVKFGGSLGLAPLSFECSLLGARLENEYADHETEDHDDAEATQQRVRVARHLELLSHLREAKAGGLNGWSRGFGFQRVRENGLLVCKGFAQNVILESLRLSEIDGVALDVTRFSALQNFLLLHEILRQGSLDD